MNWTTADGLAAGREGWDLFECSGSANGPLQLQKFDEPEEGVPSFEDDTEAWLHVWVGAAHGVELHQKALAVLLAENVKEFNTIKSWCVEPH